MIKNNFVFATNNQEKERERGEKKKTKFPRKLKAKFELYSFCFTEKKLNNSTKTNNK